MAKRYLRYEIENANIVCLFLIDHRNITRSDLSEINLNKHSM